MKFSLTLVLFAVTQFCFAQTDAEKVVFTKNNFTLEYPKTWQSDTTRAMPGVQLFLFAPSAKEEDKFRTNINVMIQDLTGQNIGLEEYKAITDKQLVALGANGEVIESVIVKKDKKEYFKTTYAMTQEQLKLKIASVCLIKNEKAYLITFCTEFDRYEQYKKVGEEILSSFMISE